MSVPKIRCSGAACCATVVSCFRALTRLRRGLKRNSRPGLFLGASAAPSRLPDRTARSHRATLLDSHARPAQPPPPPARPARSDQQTPESARLRRRRTLPPHRLQTRTNPHLLPARKIALPAALQKTDAPAQPRRPENKFAQCLSPLFRNAQRPSRRFRRPQQRQLLRSFPITQIGGIFCRADSGFFQGAALPDQNPPRSGFSRLYLLRNENVSGAVFRRVQQG